MNNFLKHSNQETDAFSWQLNIPEKAMKWCTFSHAGSISDVCIGPVGSCTQITVISGLRIYFVAQTNESLGRKGFDVKEMDWQGIVMAPGTTL